MPLWWGRVSQSHQVRLAVYQVQTDQDLVIRREGLYIAWTCKGNMFPVLELHNSVCPRSCQEPELSRAGHGHQVLGGWGWWISWNGEVSVRLEGKWEAWPLPRSHTKFSMP